MTIQKGGLSLLENLGLTLPEGLGYHSMHRLPIKCYSTLGSGEYTPYFQMNLKYKYTDWLNTLELLRSITLGPQISMVFHWSQIAKNISTDCCFCLELTFFIVAGMGWCFGFGLEAVDNSGMFKLLLSSSQQSKMVLLPLTLPHQQGGWECTSSREGTQLG